MTHSRPLSFGWGRSRLSCPMGAGRSVSPARPQDSPWTSTLPPSQPPRAVRRAGRPVATAGAPRNTSLPASCGKGGMEPPRPDTSPGRQDHSCDTHTRPVVTAVPAHTAGHPAWPHPQALPPPPPSCRRGDRMQRHGCEEAQTQREGVGGGGGRWTEGAGDGLTQRSECRRPPGGRERVQTAPGGRERVQTASRRQGSRCRRPPGGRGAGVDGPWRQCTCPPPPPGPGAPRPYRAAGCVAGGAGADAQLSAAHPCAPYTPERCGRPLYGRN